MSRTGTIRRADWLRQEISLIDELLGNLGGTSAALVGFARSRWFALTDERNSCFPSSPRLRWEASWICGSPARASRQTEWKCLPFRTYCSR